MTTETTLGLRPGEEGAWQGIEEWAGGGGFQAGCRERKQDSHRVRPLRGPVKASV